MIFDRNDRFSVAKTNKKLAPSNQNLRIQQQAPVTAARNVIRLVVSMEHLWNIYGDIYGISMI